MERAPSLFGRQVMVGVRVITVTVTGIRTASSPSPSAARHSRASRPGMLRNVHPPLPLPTAVETTLIRGL